MIKITNKDAVGCDCCNGDDALFYKDNENNAFIDSHGEMLVTSGDHSVRFQVRHCPNCGREFVEDLLKKENTKK